MSVVIATKDRPADLARTLKSLFAQDVLPRQVIIVDQGGDGQGRAVVESQIAASARAHAVQADYVPDRSTGGASAARNKGLGLAGGDIVLFLDDDVELERDHVREVLTVYRTHPNIEGVSGVITNYSAPNAGHLWWLRTFLRGPFYDERQAAYWNADRLRDADPIEVKKLGGGLMSFRRSALGDARFAGDRESGVVPGEDVEFCEQLVRRGAQLAITARARLAHYSSNSGRRRAYWLEDHATGSYLLYVRHWGGTLKGRLCFAWLNCGYVLVATASSIRRRSLEPWRALRRGALRGCRIAREERQIAVDSAHR